MTTEETRELTNRLLRELIALNEGIREPIRPDITAVAVVASIANERIERVPSPGVLARAVVAAYHMGRKERDE
jgi:hypothetical protein